MYLSKYRRFFVCKENHVQDMELLFVIKRIVKKYRSEQNKSGISMIKNKTEENSAYMNKKETIDTLSNERLMAQIEDDINGSFYAPSIIMKKVSVKLKNVNALQAVTFVCVPTKDVLILFF